MSKVKSNLIKLFSCLFAVCATFAIVTMPKTYAQESNFYVVQGASIRNGESDGLTGLRFQYKVNQGWFDENRASAYTFGALLYPTENDGLFNENADFIENVETLKAANVVNMENKFLGGDFEFNASIVYDKQSIINAIIENGAEPSEELVEKVTRNLYSKEFTARAYAVVNGNVIYSNTYSTSMYQVAYQTYKLGVNEDNEFYKSLALNYFDEVVSKTANVSATDGVIVLDENDTTKFSENAIVILDGETLVKGVDYNFNQDNNVVLDNDEYLGQTKVYYIIDNGKLYIVNAQFEEVVVTGIDAELKDTSYVYERTDDIYQNVKFRFAYSDGTFGVWKDISPLNVKSITVNGSVATAKITVTYYNVELTDTIDIATSESVLSVSQALNATVNNNYVINGIVVSFATNLSRNEWVLVDKTTGKFISVLGMGGGKLFENTFYSKSVEIGDEITIPVTLKLSTSNANKNKVYADYIGGADQKDVVVSKNNQVNFADDNIVIDSQEDLNTFLQSSNIPSNRYKVVTLRGEMNFVMDQTYIDQYKFWFYDSEATGLSSIEIGGIKPSFSNASCYYTTGKSFTNLVFDNKNTSKNTFEDPLNTVKEIKAMFIGGGTYAQFVILDKTWIKDVTPTRTSKQLVEPKKYYYVLGEELNLDGCELIYNYDIKSSESVNVTEDMVKNMPVLDTAGNYTITISDGSDEFEFEIKVLKSIVKKVEVLSTPTKTRYSHRDNINTVDLSGSKILVTYENNTTEEIDVTKDMLVPEKCDEWKLDTVNYVFVYVEHEFSLSFVYENTAISISQFKSGTVGETYDVMGIVVGPVNSQAYAEILIKDKNSNEMISIVNTGCAGKTSGNTSALSLDTSVLNIGDEVIIKAQLVRTAMDSDLVGSRNRLHGDAIDKDKFVKNLMVLSSGNSTTIDLSTATTISSNEELAGFITAWSNTYKLVKLVGVKGSYQKYGYLIYFGSKREYVNGKIPLLDITASKKYVADVASYFGNPTASPVTTEYDVYALYIGGSGTYYNFMILDSSWLVKPTSAV